MEYTFEHLIEDIADNIMRDEEEGILDKDGIKERLYRLRLFVLEEEGITN